MNNCSFHAQAQRSAAEVATGLQRIIGPAIAVHLAIFLHVIFQPILVTKFAFFSRSELVIVTTALELYGTDKFLFLVILLFGIVAPGTKLLAFAFFWYVLGVNQARTHNRWLVLIGRLAMTEIFLIAFLIMAIKGIGFGKTEIRSGLYLYTLLVLGSYGLSLWADRVIEQLAEIDLDTEDRKDADRA